MKKGKDIGRTVCLLTCWLKYKLHLLCFHVSRWVTVESNRVFQRWFQSFSVPLICNTYMQVFQTEKGCGIMIVGWALLLIYRTAVLDDAAPLPDSYCTDSGSKWCYQCPYPGFYLHTVEEVEIYIDIYLIPVCCYLCLMCFVLTSTSIMDQPHQPCSHFFPSATFLLFSFFT